MKKRKSGFVAPWKDLGYVMLILLAGLRSIPPEYQEAAAFDGASSRQIYRRITN